MSLIISQDLHPCIIRPGFIFVNKQITNIINYVSLKFKLKKKEKNSDKQHLLE